MARRRGVVYSHLTTDLCTRGCGARGRLRAAAAAHLQRRIRFRCDWGPCTIYLRYSATESINAARELAQEVRCGVDPTKREEAPLFITG